MPLSKLKTALAAVDWKGNIESLMADTKSADRLASANLQLAIWSRQFESADVRNPALCFVREMQVAG